MTQSERFNNLLEILKLNQTDFAKIAGISRQLANGIATGKYEITEKVAFALQVKLQVNAVWLLTGEGDIFITGTNTVGDDEARKAREKETEERLSKMEAVIKSLTRELSLAHELIASYRKRIAESEKPAPIHPDILPDEFDANFSDNLRYVKRTNTNTILSKDLIKKSPPGLKDFLGGFRAGG